MWAHNAMCAKDKGDMSGFTAIQLCRFTCLTQALGRSFWSLFGKKTEARNIFLSFEQSAHLLLERRKEAANIVLREILSHFRENFNWGCECV